MADDADGPSNSHIHYAIIDGNQGSPFTIDPARGEVKVTKLLDRETVSGEIKLFIQIIKSIGGSANMLGNVKRTSPVLRK